MEKNWYEIGVLLRAEFRSALERLAFTYDELRWREDRGFLSSVFYVKGPKVAIVTLNQMVEAWEGCEVNEQATREGE